MYSARFPKGPTGAARHPDSQLPSLRYQSRHPIHEKKVPSPILPRVATKGEAVCHFAFTLKNQTSPSRPGPWCQIAKHDADLRRIALGT